MLVAMVTLAKCCNFSIGVTNAHENISECCTSFAFNPNTHICCKDNVIYRNPKEKLACCGSESYNQKKSICCYDRLVLDKSESCGDDDSNSEDNYEEKEEHDEKEDRHKDKEGEDEDEDDEVEGGGGRRRRKHPEPKDKDPDDEDDEDEESYKKTTSYRKTTKKPKSDVKKVIVYADDNEEQEYTKRSNKKTTAKYPAKKYQDDDKNVKPSANIGPNNQQRPNPGYGGGNQNNANNIPYDDPYYNGKLSPPIPPPVYSNHDQNLYNKPQMLLPPIQPPQQPSPYDTNQPPSPYMAPPRFEFDRRPGPRN